MSDSKHREAPEAAMAPGTGSGESLTPENAADSQAAFGLTQLPESLSTSAETPSDGLAPALGLPPEALYDTRRNYRTAPPLSPEERERVLELAYVRGLSAVKVAQAMNRSRASVTRVLHSPDGIAMRDRLQEQARQRVAGRLVAMADKAVDTWEAQLDLASKGEKADHRGAKDLLTHAGVLDAPKGANTGTQILIQIGADATPVNVAQGENPALAQGLVLDE